MYFKACFIIGAGILVLSLLCAFILGKNPLGRLRVIGSGLILTCMVLLYAIEQNYTLSILGALQAGGLNAPYRDYFDTLAQTTVPGVGSSFLTVYEYCLYVICILSPIATGSIVLTFFDGVRQMLRYHILRRFYPVYCFSQLNERAMLLAKSIKKSVGKRILIVFCDAGTATVLHDSAKKENFILFKSNIVDLVRYGKKKNFYFVISDNQNKSLADTQGLIEKSTDSGTDHNNTQIYLFTDQCEAEIVINAMDKSGCTVTIINEPVMIAYKLLFENPLFTALEQSGGKTISLLIVGAGGIGMEIAKAAAWCGQMGTNYRLEITIVDRNAEHVKGSFQMACPELMNGEYDIRFYEADVRTYAFETVLDKHCKNANYITVCLGDEAINIKTALYLRGYYFRNSETYDNEPVLCAAVDSQIKSDCIQGLIALSSERIREKRLNPFSGKAQNYHIRPFGTYESIYLFDDIANSPIESLAMNVYTIYAKTFDRYISPQKIHSGYQSSELGKRSSRASAIHIIYKLYALGFTVLHAKNAGVKELEGSTEALKRLESLLGDDVVVHELSKLEHSRWTAFQRSEGYRSVPANDAITYNAVTNGSHIHLRAKLHPCICEWEKLDEIAKAFDPGIIKYDTQLIRNIPAIIGASLDKGGNRGNTDFILTQNRDHKEKIQNLTRSRLP